MEKCKRCLLRESAEEDVLEKIKASIEKLSPKERADDALYDRRLNECRACEHLISGICMKCGCYVEFRAAFLKQKCPNVSNRRW